MKFVWLVLCVTVSTAFGYFQTAAGDDPVKTKLEKAKASYDSAMVAYQDSVKDYFDKREESARAKGDKKQVDQLKLERQAFYENGALPKTAPTKLRQKLSTPRNTLEAAYNTAIKEYTKAKKDEEASQIEAELEQFRKGTGLLWVDLLRGKNLEGWHPSLGAKTDWSVREGVLTGRGEPGLIITDRNDYENFHLRLEAMLQEGGDSGVCFRVLDEQVKFAYEAQIGVDPKMPNTGSLVLFGTPYQTLYRATDPVPAGRWFEMEVIAEGNHIVIKIDGNTTVDYIDNAKHYQKGAIALQHIRTGAINFRKIQIQELKEK